MCLQNLKCKGLKSPFVLRKGSSHRNSSSKSYKKLSERSVLVFQKRGVIYLECSFMKSKCLSVEKINANGFVSCNYHKIYKRNITYLYVQ